MKKFDMAKSSCQALPPGAGAAKPAGARGKGKGSIDEKKDAPGSAFKPAPKKGHQVTLTVIGEGNMFGEMEILLGVPRFCTVLAVGPGRQCPPRHPPYSRPSVLE